MNKGICLAIGAALMSSTALAITPTAVDFCDPCDDISHLQGRAQWFAVNSPQSAGAIILIVSQDAPLSAFFKVNLVCSSGHCYKYVNSLTTDPGKLDNQIFGRAAKSELINITPAYNSPDSTLEAAIVGQFTYLGTGTAPWHGMPNYPASQYFDMTNHQTGDIVRLWQYDTITVCSPAGWCQKFEILTADHQQQLWSRLVNTLTHNGVRVSPPPPKPAAPVPNFGAGSGNNLWQPNSNMSIGLSPNICSGTSSVTVTAADGSYITTYGFFDFPC